MVNYSYSEKIKKHILKKSWLNNLVTPDYENYCISNLPNTLFNSYKLNPVSRNRIINPKLKEMLDDKSRIITIVIDSLSYSQLLRVISMKRILNSPIYENLLIPLTSTFPSTTPTALTSLNTGLAPEKHGIMGYSVYLKEFNSIVNMVRFSPSFELKATILNSIKIDAESFLENLTIYELLEQNGVESHVITKWNYKDSSLTKMIHKKANIIPYISLPDFFIKLRRFIESKDNKTEYIFCYWDQLDTISHIYGPNSNESYVEIYNILNMLMKLLNHIKESMKYTIIILTSDHGHHNLSLDKTIIANTHTELLTKLQIPPTGTSRATYLYPKTGKINSIEKYFKNNFKEAFYLIRSQEAIQRGLFGSEKSPFNKNERIGDLIILSKNGYSFFYPYTNNQHLMRGAHGGLSEDEMLVPLLCIS